MIFLIIISTLIVFNVKETNTKNNITASKQIINNGKKIINIITDEVEKTILTESVEEESDEDLEQETEQVKAEEETQPDVDNSYYVSANEFKYQGVVYYNGYKYTWYSENVLPGGGLVIPGRHVNSDGYVCDENNLIVVASCNFSKGTVLNTPFGSAKVYDSCPTSGVIDVYVSW